MPGHRNFKELHDELAQRVGEDKLADNARRAAEEYQAAQLRPCGASSRLCPRDLAVEVVDAIHGYTVEFAPSPDGLHEEYDTAEKVLRDRLQGVVEENRVLWEALGRAGRALNSAGWVNESQAVLDLIAKRGNH